MLVPTHLDTTHYFTWWQLLKLHYTNHPSASCQGLTWLPSARQAPFHTMVHHCKLLWWHPAQLNVHCVVPGISWVSNLGFLSNQPWTGSQHPCAPSTSQGFTLSQVPSGCQCCSSINFYHIANIRGQDLFPLLWCMSEPSIIWAASDSKGELPAADPSLRLVW